MADLVEKALSDKSKYAILDLDVQLFAKCSQASSSQREEALVTLVQKFEENCFEAGILLADLLNYSWDRLYKVADFSIILKTVVDLEFENSRMRKQQARIIALVLEMIVLKKIDRGVDLEEVFLEHFEIVSEKIQGGESHQIDLGLRIAHLFIERFDEIEGGKHIRKLYHLVPLLLPALFQAFTSEQANNHGRELVLHVFYLLIRLVAWADGIDNDLVQKCLGDNFQSWMALFLQIIQSNSKRQFDVKKQALKCLTVIFRDLINFSKDSINLILKPTWKLLNSHLPIFTEVVAYKQQILKEEGESEESEEQANVSDQSFDEYETKGVEGMTFHLLELLSTLILRPNVQSLVVQGLLPLMTTVGSYLLIQQNQEKVYKADATNFIADKSQEMLKIESIRSQCLVLISSLIEVFGDTAIQVLLFVIQNNFQTIKETKQSNQAEPESQYEESKSGSDNEEIQLKLREEQEFREFLAELTYISKHPKNVWKQREVAILLAGVFMEDISMFMIRNPQYDAQTILFDELLATEFDKAPKSLQQLLIGRSLQTALSCSDLVRMHEDGGKNFVKRVISFASETLSNIETLSVQLVVLKVIIKYTRKLKPDDLHQTLEIQNQIISPIIQLLDRTPLECMHLPIEAFTLFSKLNPHSIAEVSTVVTPKLLVLFRNHHNESALGSELLNLFKVWSNNEECRLILVETFIPFIMEIVQQYYKNTPNSEGTSKVFTLNDIASLEMGEFTGIDVQEEKDVVDAGILAHVLDLLCSLLKKAKHGEEISKIVSIFPQLMAFVEKSDDMFLLMHGTAAIKTFVHLAHKQILEIVSREKIVNLCKRLLQPSCNEQAAVCLGNLVIQVIHKVQPRIDTHLLLGVVWKIYKSRMPSTVQSLILIVARLIQTNQNEIITFLSQETIDNRIGLKIVLDKWLLQQPLFRGTYTRTVTISSLLKMFQSRDPRVETLMVIGYNPSHSNINSEVNAPFKMLSLLLRFVENESKPTKLRPLRKPIEDYDENEQLDVQQKNKNKGGAFGNYEMKRVNEKKQKEDLGMDSGARMDTMGIDDDDSYGSVEDRHNKYDLAEEDKLSVNLDDVVDDGDEIVLNQTEGPEEETKAHSSDSEQLKGSQSTGSSGNSTGNLFAVGQSKDKGLAEMETGSEVYMSELLAGFDMEDFDDAEEANEEDLQELGDEFAKVDNLVTYVKERLNSIINDEDKGCQYVYYCAKQLPKEDIELARKYLVFPKEVPTL